jgi:hypothetical protein
VRPANDVDKYPSEGSMGDPGDLSQGDHAFVTQDEAYAWHAAGTFHKNGRRPRVYETGPAADMKPGPWNKEHPDFLAHHELDDPDYPPHPDDVAAAQERHQPEWASPTGFPVRKRIDIMPGHQGTFPGENWNKYKDPEQMSPAYGPDANHPSDEEARYGTLGHPEKRSTGPANYGPPPDRSGAAPRRTGAALRAYMQGKPEPEPKYATLFDH